MNFKSLSAGAVIASVVLAGTLASAPAHAFHVEHNENPLDVNSPFNDTSATAENTPVLLATGDDLEISGALEGTARTPSDYSDWFKFSTTVSSFLSTGFTSSHVPATSLTAFLYKESDLANSVLTLSLTSPGGTGGIANLGNPLAAGNFLVNVVSSSGAKIDYTYDIEANPVPTPALLPGLIGMGVAAWRKRKGEMAEEAGAKV